MKTRILVIDVSASHIRALATGRKAAIKLPAGRRLTPEKMVRRVKAAVAGWNYTVVSIAYPGVVVQGKPVGEPEEFRGGWVGFDFEKAFGCPVKVVNDAVLQALGAYKRGRMLFLGLGARLGTALIIDGEVEQLDLANVPYRKGRTYQDYLSDAGLHARGRKKWRRDVADVVKQLTQALEITDVVIGGPNARRLRKKLPPNARIGGNTSAFAGGYRLWQEAPKRAKRRRLRRRPRRARKVSVYRSPVVEDAGVVHRPFARVN